MLKGSDNSSVIAPGLPNIVGSLNPNGGYGPIRKNANAVGAFQLLGSERGLSGEGQQTGCGLQFNASLSNAIYGNSTTVQPPTLALIPQIKF